MTILIADATSIAAADIIAVVAAAISVISIFVSGSYAAKAVNASNRADDIAMGQAETQLRASITSTQQSVQQAAIPLAALLKGRKPTDLEETENGIYGAYLSSFDLAVEWQLNAYEDACAKYRDKKIDQKRFKQNFFHEIRKLCEEKTGTIARLMQPSNTSKYKAIWAVYTEWNDLEMNPPR